MKTFPNSVLISPFTDAPYPLTDETGREVGGGSQNICNAIIQFVSLGFRNPPPSMTDIEHGIRILRTMRSIMKTSDAAINLEDADYGWLEKNLRERGPAIFGMNLSVILEAISDTVSNVTHYSEAKKKLRV